MEDFNSTTCVFVDEYGDPNLETSKQGTTEYYIITAIVINYDQVAEVNKQLTTIIKKICPNGELKSSLIGKNLKRRITILKAISSLDFHFYSLVCNKSDIYKDSGLKYKKSFIKFVSNILYQNIYKAFSNLLIYADEHGKTDFMIEFANYITQQLKPELFQRQEFYFRSSKEFPFIQLADFISGTLARRYDPKKYQTEVDLSLELINSKALRVDEWPPLAGNYFFPAAKVPELDNIVCDHALRLAHWFISERANDNSLETQLQLTVLKFLLFKYRFDNVDKYISSAAIISHIKETMNLDISEHELRSIIIAKLRDSDVIIASSSKGYKIPHCLNDIYDFVERTNNVVLPMLSRLKKTREQYILRSKGKLDIMALERFKELKELL